MQCSADGTWSATIGPVEPGFHDHWLLVDGVQANDLSSEVSDGAANRAVGRCPPRRWISMEPETSRMATSGSTGTARRRPACAGFTFTRLPATTPVRRSAIRCCTCNTEPVRANAVGPRRARQLHPRQPHRGRQGEADDRRDGSGYAVEVWHYAGRRCPRNEAFGDVVIRDLIPEIDKSYRTRPDRAQTALAGSSTVAARR